jgi:glycosyltransferase involved in cell wall biosynthesis
MKPLRVTYLITDSGVGGAEKMAAALIRGLDRTRFEPSLLAMKPLGETAAGLLEEGVPVASLGLPGRVSGAYFFRLPGAFRQLCQELKRQKTDILHCFLFQANFLGRIAARITGVPKNISSLRVMEAEHRSQFFLDRLTSSWVTRWTAVGEAVKRFACEKIGLDPARITVIPNGIALAELDRADRGIVRREFGIPSETPLLGTIGRLHPQKGVDLLLRAVQELKGQFPALKTLIVGEGPALPALRALASDLGLVQDVIFTGLRRDVPDILAAADLLVLASRWEGMPNVVLEAFAAGKAVVATRVGAVEEMVQDGETGLLVPAEDPPALARAIGSLLADPPGRARLAAAGRARVEKEFSLEKMVRLTQELYEDVWHLRRAR